MKDIFILTKVLYRNSMGINLAGKNNKKTNTFGRLILILLLLAYVMGIFGFLSYEIIKVLIELKQEEVFISFSLLVLSGYTLLRTIFTAMNILYFSKDVEFLLPLPISSIKIVFAKFNIMAISNFINAILIFAVPFCIYCYLLNLSFVFLINSFLVIFVINIIPMLIGSVLIVLIMNFTSIFRNKDFVQYISVILTIGLIFGIQMFTSSNEATEFVLANKIVEINGYSHVITKYLFTVRQGTEAIINSSIKDLAFLYLESFGAYLIIIFLISKFYLRSALKSTASGIRASKVSMKGANRRNLGITYLEKEFKSLFRTPIYLMQCVLPSFLFPIIFSIPIYQQYGNTGLSGNELNEISKIVGELLSSGFGIGIILVIINFLYMFNFMSVTSISREGENALFMKYIPIRLSRQYKLKALPGFIINLVPLIYVLVVLKLLIPSFDLLVFFEIIILAILSNFVVNYFSVFIDLMNPKLHWTTEYAVVKQNINMFYGFIVSLIVIGIIIGLSSYIDNINILTITLSGIMIFILLIFEVFLRKYENKIFKKIS